MIKKTFFIVTLPKNNCPKFFVNMFRPLVPTAEILHEVGMGANLRRDSANTCYLFSRKVSLVRAADRQATV